MQHFYLGYREVILTDITYLLYSLERDVYHCLFRSAHQSATGEGYIQDDDVERVKEAYQDMMNNA